MSDERRIPALGLDFGRKRIGVARSDPSGTLASPHTTLVRRLNRRPPYRTLEEIADTVQARTLVMGLPLELDGSENDWCAEVREAGRKISERLDRPIVFVDERLTSVQAEEAIRSAGLRKKDREDKARIDAAAAAVILQSWLDGAVEL
ncbi:MAG TPA: Holliday junction resolvase RuvX [Longimicrobiales bacterium]|nr:Holliday junction resolvase RuvX [Longimicrobiales bacterium]